MNQIMDCPLIFNSMGMLTSLAKKNVKMFEVCFAFYMDIIKIGKKFITKNRTKKKCRAFYLFQF